MAEKTLIPDARHEPRDISARFILFAFLLLITSVAAVGLISWAVFPRSTADRPISDAVTRFPGPQLQPDPHADWRRFYTAEIRRLTTYGWVDKAHGIVHIPIDEAMRETVARGISGWPTPARPKQ
ncbi:MAG TPA: hypothetical protein VFW75_13580 [Acetobacteraceae bacterium]|nr:hypothetical protein [Acetobacteraceae bacterium]